MAYEQVENDSNSQETERSYDVWSELAQISPRENTSKSESVVYAQEFELPELDIIENSPDTQTLAEASSSAETSIQGLIIKANEQLTKLMGDLPTAEFKQLLEDLKHEKEIGEFGPASQKAFKQLIENLQTKQLPQHLRALTEYGIPVPPGFPSRETGSSDGLQLFARRITSTDRQIDLQINTEKPTEQDLVKLAQSFDWLISADKGIESYAKQRELKYLKSRIDELGLSEWEYKEGEDREAWIRSAKGMVDLTDRVSNTIRAMHYLYKSSADGDFPVSLPEGATITLLFGNSQRRTISSQELNKSENRYLLKDGSIESIRLDLPSDLRADHLGNKLRIGVLQDWLETNAKPVTETLMRLSETKKDPRSIIYWGEDEISHGQAVFNSKGEFTGKIIPQGQTPEAGETTKHANLVDYDFSVEEIQSGPDKGKLLIKQTIEAADAAPWAYQNIRWLGVDSVGKPMTIVHKPVDKDAFLPVRTGNSIELIPAKNLERYKAGKKLGSFTEKTVTGLMDTAMVFSGTIELGAALKASKLASPQAQAVLKLTERETIGQVNHALFRVGLGGSGVLNNAGGKELQVGGISGQELLTLRSLIFVGEAAKGVGGTFRSALSSAEAPSLTTAAEKVRTFIQGQSETAVLPALPPWSPVNRIHKLAEYSFRGTELVLAPEIAKDLIHQLKEFNRENRTDSTDEALNIRSRLLGLAPAKPEDFDTSNPESATAAELLLKDYSRMITEGKDPKVRERVAAVFAEVEKALHLDSSNKNRAELANTLAQDLILSQEELSRLEKAHPDYASSSTRQLNEKELTRLRNGSMTEDRMKPLLAEYNKIMEERKSAPELNIARTIGLLYLTRSQDGKVPAQIDAWLSVPRMEKTYQAESAQYKPQQAILAATELKQSISSQQLIDRLVQYSTDKATGNNVITGGDVLVRLGVVDRLSYGLALQDVLESKAATREDKYNALFDARGGRMAASYELAASQPIETARFGARPHDFIQRLRRDAANEKDVDVKAALIALSVIFQNPQPSDRISRATWLNEKALQLKSEPGALAREVQSFLKEQIDSFDISPIARLDAASALLAVQPDETAAKNLARITDDLIKSKNAEELAELFSSERLESLITSGALLDRRRFERLQSAILPHIIPGEDAQSDSLAMKLAGGLHSLQSRTKIARPEDRQKLTKTLRDLIDTESQSYAAGSPTLRVFAINSLVELGDQRSLPLLRARVANKDATSDTGEPSPLVRATALKALEKLKDPEFPMYIGRLSETESDPAILEMIATANYDVSRSEPSSAQFKETRDRLGAELLGPSFFDGSMKEVSIANIKQFIRDNDFQLLEGSSYINHVAEAIDNASTAFGRANPLWSRESVSRDEMTNLVAVHNRRRSQLKELTELSGKDSEAGKLATLALEKILTDKAMTVFISGADKDFFKHKGEYIVHTTPQLPFEVTAAKALRANSSEGSPHREITQWAVKRALTNGSNLSADTISELIGALKELRQGDRPAISRTEAVSLVMHVFEENITRLPKEQSEQAQLQLISAMMEFNDRAFIPVLDLVARFSNNPTIKAQANTALERLRDAGTLMWNATPVDLAATAQDRMSSASKALLTGKDTEVVVQTLFNAYKGQSISDGDPALTWLRRALSDKEERIQLAATRILLESKLPKNHPLMQQTATVLSQIAKNSKRNGLRFEAMEQFGSLSKHK